MAGVAGSLGGVATVATGAANVRWMTTDDGGVVAAAGVERVAPATGAAAGVTGTVSETET